MTLLNFGEISQSTAEILLLPVSKNRPNFTELWRHMNFPRWRPLSIWVVMSHI